MSSVNLSQGDVLQCAAGRSYSCRGIGDGNGREGDPVEITETSVAEFNVIAAASVVPAPDSV